MPVPFASKRRIHVRSPCRAHVEVRDVGYITAGDAGQAHLQGRIARPRRHPFTHQHTDIVNFSS